MAKSISRKKSSIFEQIKESDENGNEFWSARKLSKILDYSEFRNFIPVIERAKEACINSNQKISDHFVDVHDMVEIGSGAKRAVDDVKLSRYACYLIVQNADPGKEIVAIGQTYFAVQTRLQEIQQMDDYNLLKTEEDKRLFLRNELRKHNSQLAETAKGAGVIKSIDYAIFQNHGYMGLYGGLDAKAIHQKKNLKKNQQILDHMGSTELAANLFRATQTEEKIRREKIKGKSNANKTHYEVGHKVRNTIKELGGAMPEDLPTENSIKLIEKPKDKTKKEVKVKKKSKGSRR
ncbi:MAG: DNA damage-inducible protein D [Leptospiraceae bacterium]|nr:DNA damage-inducible protein D [Leptospiraceae bacterium]MBL0266181.1 DNA damage-inducible protein D [Leptospiraceae bacterium]